MDIPYWVAKEADELQNHFFRDPDRFYRAVGASGHEREWHVNQSGPQLMDRLLQGQLPAVSAFLSDDIFRETWETMILDYVREIVTWQAKGKNTVKASSNQRNTDSVN